MELVTGQSAISRDSFKHSLKTFLIFSLLVYIAHYSFLDDALYKFTNLLTYLLKQHACV